MGDHSVWASRPLFSRRWNRHPAQKRKQGWRRNWASARGRRPSSVIWSAEVTIREERRKHARNSQAECRFGRAAYAMCPVAFSILERRKPVAAEYLGAFAASVASPLLFPRRRRPLGPTSVTSAKKLSEALRRKRHRCVSPRQTSPSREGKPTPAQQVREVAATAVSPQLRFPQWR